MRFRCTLAAVLAAGAFVAVASTAPSANAATAKSAVVAVQDAARLPNKAAIPACPYGQGFSMTPGVAAMPLCLQVPVQCNPSEDSGYVAVAEHRDWTTINGSRYWRVSAHTKSMQFLNHTPHTIDLIQLQYRTINPNKAYAFSTAVAGQATVQPFQTYYWNVNPDGNVEDSNLADTWTDYQIAGAGKFHGWLKESEGPIVRYLWRRHGYSQNDTCDSPLQTIT
jgi:hypothetical protein